MNNPAYKIIIFVTMLMCLLSKTHAQNSTLKKELKGINYIEIHFFKLNKTLLYRTKKSIDIQYLTDLITKAKNDPTLQCDTTGEIIYFKGKTALFSAYFCTRETGSKYNSTGVVSFKNSTNKMKALLNYGTGMLINETYYQLNKTKTIKP